MRHNQKGAVSLFIVIFTALLVTTITVAFVRIMIQDQQQASANDLSKSALDSAYAGVEDAKRVIATYRQHCMNAPTTECEKIRSALGDGNTCNTIQRSGILGNQEDAKEVVIKQTEDDADLQQAYTCVKILLNTFDFVGTVAANSSRLIPLNAGEGTPFNQVTVEWYSQEDIQKAGGENETGTGDAIDLSSDRTLPKLAEWPTTRPALLRTQLIQFGEKFTLADLDKSDGADNTNTSTLFLLPSLAGAGVEQGIDLNFNLDKRQSPDPSVLQEVGCNKNFSATSSGSLYACRVRITLPNPIGENDGSKRTAYLKVNALYNSDTHFRVSLSNDSRPVTFSGVQPMIDSTGRANDFFRRVQSRVELESSSVPYVEAAVDITGSLCKAFLVTDQEFEPGPCSTQ